MKSADVERWKKKRDLPLIVWLVVVVVTYVLLSGPAILIERRPIGRVIDVLYLPLRYIATYTPAHRILLPYWEIWMEKSGYEGCPFIVG